jgi:glucosamine-6-phosphate deaminase
VSIILKEGLMGKVIRKTGFSVEIYATRKAMGEAAGKKAEELLVAFLKQKKEVRIIAASAPSQNEILAYLAKSKLIDWSRITAFHMDEYIGIADNAPQNFGKFLKDRLFGRVPVKVFHCLQSNADPARECARYTALLKKAPIDLLLGGIGENGHLAFNDPPVADFNDPHMVKVIKLDSISRNQQVHDGCFSSLREVPRTALTLTIPTLQSAASAVYTVPKDTKAAAVGRMFKGPVETKCPSSILRFHPDCYVFLDAESGKELLRPKF